MTPATLNSHAPLSPFFRRPHPYLTMMHRLASSLAFNVGGRLPAFRLASSAVKCGLSGARMAIETSTTGELGTTEF